MARLSFGTTMPPPPRLTVTKLWIRRACGIRKRIPTAIAIPRPGSSERTPSRAVSDDRESALADIRYMLADILVCDRCTRSI